MRRFPYGETNFELIRSDGKIFVDKTKYIAELEQQPSFQFFIRPRRFGKTLWLSVLENYYDVYKADKFVALFGDLAIGKQPTVSKNSYLILRLSFAGIATDNGKDVLISDFYAQVRSSAENFCEKYFDLLQDKVVATVDSTAISIIGDLYKLVARCNQRMFLIIDEYDNFANELIASDDKELYYDLISGEGYVKAFYKAIKEGTSSGIERLFMTGVSPVMLDDLTSGFNITANLTLKPELNGMLGLTDAEVEELARQVCPREIDLTRLQEDLRLYFNGYKFSVMASERIYNTNMVIYFMEELRQSGRYPQYILDRNVVTDYRKTEMLARKFDAYDCLQNIAGGGTVTTRLVDRFDLNTIFAIKDNYWSLLFYLGLLTIKSSQFSYVALGIPNYAIKLMFWENFGETLRAQTQVVRSNDFFEPLTKMALEGDANDFTKQFEHTFIQLLSYRDLIQLDEKHIKLALLAILHLGGTFLVDSERELGDGYADILLSENPAYPNSAKYEWIIELKYLKKKSLKEYERIVAEAKSQAERYRSAYIAKYNNGKIVKTLVLICSGKGKLEIANIG
ncbi:MAG: AAA family ATPase [Bacillota bacterium]